MFFLFIGAVLCKQDKLTLPLVILLMDYLLLSRPNWRRMKQNWPTYALFAAGLLAGSWFLVKPFLLAGSVGFHLPWQEYLVTEFRIWFLYLRLLLVPFGLNADYDITPSKNLAQHLSWLALIGLVLLLAAAIAYRRRAPLEVFGGLFLFIVLVVLMLFLPPLL